MDVYNKRHVLNHLVRCVLKDWRVTGDHPEVGVILDLLIIRDEAFNVLLLVLDNRDAVLNSVDHLVDSVIDIFAVLDAAIDLLESESH